ncbi:MAG: hypothetical protein OEW95_08650 [Candidatus Bathyarchaeota archaeon]|nr:hypothetical protein [Candidatus Bathyarchaeota archaeon]
MVEEERAFYSASIDDQMNIVLEAMIFRNLQQLKTRIELKSNPVRNWEKSMELMLLSSPSFMYHEGWLTEKCVKEKEYREKILQKIDELIKKVEDKDHGSS